MNSSLFRPVRALSCTLAAVIALGSTALAADSARLKEQNVSASVVEEKDAPIAVGKLVTGTVFGIGTVSTEGVNVRNNPNKNAEVLGGLLLDQQVIVLSKDGDWYRVSCEGMTGFVHQDYMTISQEGTVALDYGMVKAEGANVRTTASEDGEVITALTSEDAVTITGISGEWYQVTVGDVSGYIRSDLVDPTAEVPAQKIFDYTVIAGEAVNLRSEPNEASDKTDVLYAGSLCTLIEQVGDWYQVQYGDTIGYVQKDLVTNTNNAADGSTELETYNDVLAREEEEARKAEEQRQAEEARKAEEQRQAEARKAAQAAPAPSYSDPTPSYTEPTYTEPSYNSSGSSDIVSVAKQYLGVPYVWGGTSPSGFDCSGFVQYVFRQCGYSVTRTADTQYYDGTPVSYSNLQAGDLVFFVNTYATSGISHIGIYIGGGQFIHCANGGVKISSLGESYYSSRYYGACRVA